MKNKGKSIFDRQLVYSIRKSGVGTASIMIGSFIFGQHLVAAQQIDPPLDTTASPQIEGISQTSKQEPPINSSTDTIDPELEASPVNESISTTENESTSQLLMFARESSEETTAPTENRVEEITPVSNPSADFNKFTFTGS
ncbi:TPA: YSIRK-type signal peptide-containing protein [Streptococcus suis]